MSTTRGRRIPDQDRSPVGPRELARRTRELRRRLGQQIVELRFEANISQAQLARCVDIDPAHLWRIEAGSVNASLDVLVAIAACLGCDTGIRLFPSAGPRIHDRFQAPMLEALIEMVGSEWTAQPEVPVPAARGVIDLVLRRASDHVTIVCECHSELRRLELALRRLAEKRETIVGQVGHGGPASSLLLLRSTSSTRAVARAFEATLAVAFPARSADAIEALKGDAPWPGPSIVWARVERGRAAILEEPPRGIRVGR